MAKKETENEDRLDISASDSKAEVFQKINKFLKRHDLSERDEFLIHTMISYCIAIEQLEKATGKDGEYLTYLIANEAHKQKKSMTKKEKIEFLKETLNQTPLNLEGENIDSFIDSDHV